MQTHIPTDPNQRPPSPTGVRRRSEPDLLIHRRVYTKIEGPSLTPFIKQLKAIVRRVFVNRCQVGVLRCAPGQCFEDQLYSNGT